VEQVHIVRAQVVSVDLEALELELDLIRPRIAVRGLIRIPRLIVGVPARLPALACRASIATGLELHGVEQRDVAARFGALSPHVETVVDAPALGGGEAGRDGAGGFIIFDVVVKDGAEKPAVASWHVVLLQREKTMMLLGEPSRQQP
jgi:hypothetical protein